MSERHLVECVPILGTLWCVLKLAISIISFRLFLELVYFYSRMKDGFKKHSVFPELDFRDSDYRWWRDKQIVTTYCRCRNEEESLLTTYCTCRNNKGMLIVYLEKNVSFNNKQSLQATNHEFSYIISSLPNLDVIYYL